MTLRNVHLGVFMLFLFSCCSSEAPFPTDAALVDFSLRGIGGDVSAATRGENLASGATVRVVVYKGTTYLDENTYTADGKGGLTSTGGEMRLIEGAYDFYAVSPALTVVSKTTSGPTFSVEQGVDFAAVKVTQEVTAYSGSGSSAKCTVALGELARKCAKLTFNIEPGSDIPLPVSALKVTGITLTHQPSSQTATGASLNASAGSSSLTIPASAFTTSGNKVSGSTIVLPKTSGSFNITMNVQFNGASVTVTFPALLLPAMSFEAAKNHLFTIKLLKDRVGIWSSVYPAWNSISHSPDLGGTDVDSSVDPIWGSISHSSDMGGTNVDSSVSPDWGDINHSSGVGENVDSSISSNWGSISHSPSLGSSDANSNK